MDVEKGSESFQKGEHWVNNEEIKKIIGELDLHRLRKQLIKAGYGSLQVSIGDLFACGCYFIKQGKKELGQKLCRTALIAYQIDHSLISRILNIIEGEEYELSQLLNPHVEVPDWLFDS